MNSHRSLFDWCLIIALSLGAALTATGSSMADDVAKLSWSALGPRVPADKPSTPPKSVAEVVR